MELFFHRFTAELIRCCRDFETGEKNNFILAIVTNILEQCILIYSFLPVLPCPALRFFRDETVINVYVPMQLFTMLVINNYFFTTTTLIGHASYFLRE